MGRTDESRNRSGSERTEVHVDTAGECSARLVGASVWRGRHRLAAVLSADHTDGESEGLLSRPPHTAWWNLVDLDEFHCPLSLSDLGQDSFCICKMGLITTPPPKIVVKVN